MHRAALLTLVGCGRLGFTQSPDAGDASPARDIAEVPDALDAYIAPPADSLMACTKLAISDDFNDGVRAAAWTLMANNPVSVAETGGSLQVTLATAGGAHYGGYDSAAPFDLRDHCMYVTYVQVPTNEAMVEMTFGVRTPVTSTGFVYHLGIIDAYVNTGTYASLGAVTYVPAVHKVLLVREDAGMMTWETSPDGITFSILTQHPTPIDVSAVTLIIEAGTFGSAPSPGMGIFDNFDVP